MQMPFNQIQQAPQKVDICFYDAYVGVRGNYKCEIGFYSLRALLVLWYLITHYLNKETDDQNVYELITVLFYMLIAFNIANLLLSNWVFRNVLADSRRVNEMAYKIQHCFMIDEGNPQQQQTYYLPQPQMNLKVSKTVYQFENNLLANEVENVYKERAQRQCQALINHQISANDGVRCFTQFLNLCSISLFTYTVILMSEGKGVTSSEFVFLCCYLFTQFCARFFIYLILTIIGLTPVFCLVCCVYFCFFKKQKKVQLPPPSQATLDIVRQCEGNCPICYQNVNLKEQVIVLKCSPKHVFHQICIKGWTSIGKDTCPVCRAEI